MFKQMETKTTRQMDASRLRCPSLLKRIALAMLLSLLASNLTGCRIYNSFHNSFVEGPVKCYRDRIWGERAYNMRYWQCRNPRRSDFRRGFIDGYCSVCEGNDGFVPAVPPQHYWSLEYQNKDGAQCVNTWFNAYPEGARVAKRDEAGAYNNIYISRMMESAITQEKAPNVLPADVPIVSPKLDNTAGSNQPVIPASWNDGSNN